MNARHVVDEITKYETEFAAILSRFIRVHDGIDIGSADDRYCRSMCESLLICLTNVIGQNSYSKQIAGEFNQGISNYMWSPSYKSVQGIWRL